MNDHATSEQTGPRGDWKNATAARGVPHAARAPFSHRRRSPGTALAPFVAHYWHVAWDLPEGQAHHQATLPHPSVHLVHEDGAWRLYGVQTRRFLRVLHGRDSVTGVKFHPGMFRAFLGRDVATLTDRVIEATAVFGTMLPPDADLDALEARLRPPAGDDDARQARHLVRTIETDHTLLRADQLSARTGIPPRSLQRLFRAHVGVGPKWILRRVRLHEALARIDDGLTLDWARFALDLGYTDQSHFITDFRTMVGTTPARYAHSR